MSTLMNLAVDNSQVADSLAGDAFVRAARRGEDDHAAWRESWRAFEQICIDRLAESLGASPCIFNRQLRDAQWDRTHGTEDLTSTAIAIIGLTRSGNADFLASDNDRILNDILEIATRRQYGGAFGLLLWANAVHWRLDFDKLVNRSGLVLNDPVAHIRKLTTMETAWLVSGALHQRQFDDSPRLGALTNAALTELEQRFDGASELFVHADPRAAINKRLRRNVPNFADQIYSIQALGFAALTEQSDRAASIAHTAAQKIVQLQGPLGQWWWHYDTKAGEVAKTYPVYAVHQHAMAPMALMLAARVSGTDFGEAIGKSLRWVDTNEMGHSLVDQSVGTIWRDIQPPQGHVSTVLSSVRAVAGLHRPVPARETVVPDSFALNRETRPYEWAWCLYAQAQAEQRPTIGHLY